MKMMNDVRSADLLFKGRATAVEEEYIPVDDREYLPVSDLPADPFRERFGMRDDDIRATLVVAGDDVAMLTTEPGLHSAVAPRIVRTYSIDEFKAWMTTPESAAAKHYPAPEREWSGRAVTHPD